MCDLGAGDLRLLARRHERLPVALRPKRLSLDVALLSFAILMAFVRMRSEYVMPGANSNRRVTVGFAGRAPATTPPGGSGWLHLKHALLFV